MIKRLVDNLDREFNTFIAVLRLRVDDRRYRVVLAWHAALHRNANERGLVQSVFNPQRYLLRREFDHGAMQADRDPVPDAKQTNATSCRRKNLSTGSSKDLISVEAARG